ncbi:IS256 family transposase [Candidatus Jorgensenbacteria bacterium]|nr:IS256 family transposase [Candidatus Jorgensenbacteria bacterium]
MTNSTKLSTLVESQTKGGTVMPAKRIPPSQAISNEIMNLLNSLKSDSGQSSNQETFGKIVQLGIRKLVQEILEKEVREHIGQGYYEQGLSRDGYRNGYEPDTLRTAENHMPIQKPQVRDSQTPFSSQLWPYLKGRTEQLEKIAVEMYARGCSTRDIEDLLKDENGRILLSKSAVSQLNQRLWDEYEQFCKTDLKDYDVVYIFADAVYESLRLHKSRKEGILVVWAILSSGAKVLLSMQLGNKESYDDWCQVFRDLKKRHMNTPVLGTSDGAPGLIQAFEESFPKTLRQRCLFHKKGNILSKVPQEAHSEVKAYLHNIYYAADIEMARKTAEIFNQRFGVKYPSAVTCFKDDLDACLSHLRCPAKHRKNISTTNLVERSFGEEKRRSKVIPRFFNEKSGLTLAFASLIRASARWNRIKISFDEQAQLLTLRHELGHEAIKEHIVTNNQRKPSAKFLQVK